MKKFKIISLIISILFFTSSLEADIDLSKPLWEQVSELTCKGKLRVDCIEGDCDKGASTAMWKIDFLDNSIVYLNMDFKEKIQNKYHKYYDVINLASNTIHFGGRLMVFEIDLIENFKNGIPSVTIGASATDSGVKINSTYYDCFPS